MAQVGIGDDFVDYSANCGNLSAAVGLFGVLEGYVDARGMSECVVRIHNTNTGKMLLARVPVVDDQPATDGDVHIDGVPGTAPGIALDYRDTAGAITGSLLPLGQATAEIQVDGLGPVCVSVVDLSNLIVYIAAESLGLGEHDDLDARLADEDMMCKLEAVRGAAAHAVGLASSPSRARVESPLTPQLAVVSPPRAFRAMTDGRPISANDMNLAARIYTAGALHRSYPGTGLANIAVAVQLLGSLPNIACAASRGGPADGEVVVGHPCGLASARGRVGPHHEVLEASYLRTARRILVGEAFL
jgi:2-methylaconitate cis-trans-isomerase PrpF